MHAPANISGLDSMSPVDEKAVMDTISRLKDHVAARLGAAVKEIQVERTESLTDCIDFISLVITTQVLDAKARMKLREELNQIICSSESLVVRERVIVNFR